MYAIEISEPGGPEVLRWVEVPDPVPGNGEVLIEVAASAVNRADLLQRQGNYPPPPGASEILGLECAGVIRELGENVVGWKVGDEVCALLAGGGYAEKVVAPASQLLPVSKEVGMIPSAGLPEVACTVWSNVVMTAHLSAGEVLLIHGGAGGIGTHAIQVGKALGATVAVTAGSAERLRKCQQLGADILINYREQDFVEILREQTNGANVIVDNMGASYLDRNIQALALNGRLVVLGFQGGVKANLNLSSLMRKQGTLISTGLRSRSIADKGHIINQVREKLWPLIEDGSVKPVIDQIVPLKEAAKAHREIEGAFGKVLLSAH